MRLLVVALMVMAAMAQPLMVTSEACLDELFDSNAGKWNVYARAGNAWVTFIKEKTPGPSPQAQARYAEDLWKLQKDMERDLERLHASRCYPTTKSGH